MIRISRRWQIRVSLGLSLVATHAALFYEIARTPSNTSGSDSPPMFGPVVSEYWRDIRQHHITSREWTPRHLSGLTNPPSHWHFAPIDIWPTDRPPRETTGFTPVSEADPDSRRAVTERLTSGTLRTIERTRSKLRMIGWARPVYTTQEAQAGRGAAVSLELHVDSKGRPAEVRLTVPSGNQQLDSSTLQAARLWRFAPPTWRDEPMSVWVDLEIRYHGCEAETSASKTW